MMELRAQANPASLFDHAGASRASILKVPLNDPIDAALHPNYLQACAAKVGFEAGDVIELRSNDLSWRAQLLILSINKIHWTVTTHLLMGPTFLLDPPDRNPTYIVERISALEREFIRDRKVSPGEYPERLRVLVSLRDEQRYPNDWLADKLVQLDRALVAQILTKRQHDAARHELYVLMGEDQAREVKSLAYGAAEAPAINGAEKSKKAAKPILVTPTPPASA
jgi:hypothetical protein